MCLISPFPQVRWDSREHHDGSGVDFCHDGYDTKKATVWHTHHFSDTYPYQASLITPHLSPVNPEKPQTLPVINIDSQNASNLQPGVRWYLKCFLSSNLL